MSRSSKKRNDERRRNARVAEKRRIKRALRDVEFPPFVFHIDEHAPKELVDAVAAIIGDFNFQTDPELNDRQRLFYSGLTTSSARDIIMGLIHRDGESSDEFWVTEEIIHHLGSLVLSRLPQTVRQAFFPFNDVELAITPEAIDVVIRSLVCVQAEGRTFYHSRHEPKIEFEGRKYVVAFQGHAIDRTAERICPHWDTYAGMADLFAYFDQCSFFEPASVSGAAYAFAFYDECPLTHFRREVLNVKTSYATDIVGIESLMRHRIHGTRYYYRVGYCPVDLVANYAVARTLLFPGFKATPERAALSQSRLPREQIEQMASEAFDLSAIRLYETGNFKLLKWFHDNGVPQVVTLELDPYLPAVATDRLSLSDYRAKRQPIRLGRSSDTR